MLKILPSLENRSGSGKLGLVGCGCNCGPEDDEYMATYLDLVEGD